MIKTDHDRILSGGFDGKVLVWKNDLSASEIYFDLPAPIDALSVLEDHRTGVRYVIALAGQEMAVAMESDGETVIARRAAERLSTLSNNASPNSCLGYHDGRILCGVPAQGEVWEQTIEISERNSVKGLTVTASSGQQVVAASFASRSPIVYRIDDDALRAWWHMPEDDIGTAELTSVADGTVLRGGISGDLDVFSIDGEKLGSAHAHDAPIIAVDANDDGSIAVTGGANGAVTLWNIDENGPSPMAIVAQFTFPVLDVVVDEANSRVIVAHAQGHLAAIGFDERAGGQGPAKPARLFAHNQTATEPQSHGQKLFNACIACHSLTLDRDNKMGPPFGNLFGRKAGTIEGYPYSKALQESDLIWDETTLSALFEEGPEHYLPGTTMPMQMMPDEADRAALIGYMKEATQP